jgi:RNA polymerase sigma-70 factor, ECF subfamily
MDQTRSLRHSGETGQARVEEQFQQVFCACQDELFGSLVYLVGNPEDARDALQETFLKCWRRRTELSGVQNLRAWIFRVAINAGRDIRSTAWRRRRRPLADGDPGLTSADDPVPGAAARREELARVQQALQELRAEEQEVFLLRQNGQLTYEQIAESIQLPVGTVKTRMRLALRKLREALE